MQIFGKIIFIFVKINPIKLIEYEANIRLRFGNHQHWVGFGE